LLDVESVQIYRNAPFKRVHEEPLSRPPIVAACHACSQHQIPFFPVLRFRVKGVTAIFNQG